MTRYAVLVEVALRPGIADPEGATIERTLPALGFGGIERCFRASEDSFVLLFEFEESWHFFSLS